MNLLSINQNQDISEIREEYRSLKHRAETTIESWEEIFWTIHIALTITVTIFAGIKTHNVGDTLLAAFIYGYMPGMFASGIIATLVYLVIGKRWERYRENRRLRSSWFHRYQYLKEYIQRYDEEERLRLEEEKRILAEEKRIRLLPVRNEIQGLIVQLRGNKKIISELEGFFQRKKKWYPEYRGLEEKVHSCIEQADALDAHGVLIKEKFINVAEEASSEFLWLFNSISDLRSRCKWMLSKMQSMKDWTPPVRTTPNTITQRDPRSNSLQQPRTSGVRSPNNSNEPEQNLSPVFSKDILEPNAVVPPPSNRRIVEETAPPPPPKAREPLKRTEHMSVAGISTERYLEIAQEKIDVGDLGEGLAMDYEKRRVETQEGESRNSVRRVSADSTLGYDIESISKGAPVYIEVKTTKGRFDADLLS